MRNTRGRARGAFVKITGFIKKKMLEICYLAKISKLQEGVIKKESSEHQAYDIIISNQGQFIRKNEGCTYNQENSSWRQRPRMGAVHPAASEVPLLRRCLIARHKPTTNSFITW